MIRCAMVLGLRCGKGGNVGHSSRLGFTWFGGGQVDICVDQRLISGGSRRCQLLGESVQSKMIFKGYYPC